MFELGPLQKEWMRRARSGEYRPGIIRLCKRNHDGKLCYCFLGIACTVYEDMVKPLERKEDEEYGTVSFKDGNSGVDCVNSLPPDVAETMRLHSIGGEIRGSYSEEYECLWKLNDVHGWKFEQIADFVEANPESVFSGPI